MPQRNTYFVMRDCSFRLKLSPKLSAVREDNNKFKMLSTGIYRPLLKFKQNIAILIHCIMRTCSSHHLATVLYGKIFLSTDRRSPT